MKLHLSERAWVVALFIGAIATFGPGNITGALWPAAVPMKLTSVKISADGRSTIFGGTTARLRPGCNFKAFDWQLGSRTGRSTPIQVDTVRPIVRPDGVFVFAGWTADVVPPETFVHNTYADVLHICRIFYKIGPDGLAKDGYILPWTTRSRFWN